MKCLKNSHGFNSKDLEDFLDLNWKWKLERRNIMRRKKRMQRT